ncbi:MAG: ATP-binding protein [Lutibacter sp.]|nr:ATP-binding protein [Lutibacter sp.]MDT8418505.1 ATP-binding protein [Lutibacter sp.]
MKIAHFIRKDFLTVNPYSGINAVKNQVLEHLAVVVQDDEEEFYGVLTTNDIAHNPKTLIIDCLTVKELIDSELSVEDTILKMDTAKTDVLPVGENDKFIGLVFKNELYQYISDYNIELESIIKSRTKELEEAIATKDLVFSIIAHDLKSPFNAILGFTELLKNKIRNLDVDKSEKLISSMYFQARNTYNLLENLLNWARSNSNQIVFNPISCNISSICDAIINQIGDSAQLKNLKINSYHTNDCYAFADKNMLEVILRNLLSNAIKYTESNGEIEIYSMPVGEIVEITVSDNGIGMTEDVKDKLFKSDLHESKPGTDNERGTGLGLVICHDFIKRNHGKIWIENNDEKGTSIKFTLPIYKEKVHELNKIAALTIEK